MKEISIDAPILTTQTFSVQADREYQRELFVFRERKIASIEDNKLAEPKDGFAAEFQNAIMGL